jgi:hypothetical protein
MGQTLKFGNGTWATKKGSTLAYNDEDGNFKPLPFTYTGAGKGTRVNKEGLIEVVENDRPRIDYLDSEDGVLLLEKASTNLITYSEDFSNGSWTKTASTITSNATISPDGSLNADKLVENTQNVAHITFASPTITLGNNTFSIFAKAAERRVLGIEFPSNGILVSFDLIEGVFVNSQANPDDFSITPYSNGWYRIDITENLTSSSVVSLSLRDDNGNRTYQGNGTSGIYVWGAQLETGNASSYIPTQGNPQTRVQETASGSGNSEVFNSEQGVLFANIAANADDSTYRSISINNGSTSNYVQIGFDSSGSNKIFGNIRPSGSSFSVTTSNIVNFNKVLIKYKVNDCSLWINGFEVGIDLNGVVPSGLNELGFDTGGVATWYGKAKEIAYYDEILTDEELEYMTSYRTWEEMVKELNLNIIHNE